MSTCYFLLNVALSHEQEVIDKIKSILSAEKDLDFEIQGVYGVYDIIVKITSSDQDQMRCVALEKIRTIDKIQSAITMMINQEQETIT